MSGERQYIGIAFREGGSLYTYHNDGAPVAVGDKVIIPARNGGQQVVTVADIAPPCFAPKFETKPIIGLAPADDEPPPLAA
jgi:hypothetical protein